MNRRKVFICGMVNTGSFTQALIQKIESEQNIEIIITQDEPIPKVAKRVSHAIEIPTVIDFDPMPSFDQKQYGKHHRRELNRYKSKKRK